MDYRWIDARKKNPPDSKHGREYLVILESRAKTQNCKTWVGMGSPETCTWCSDWVYGWSSRGTLCVAYWMPLPRFNMMWDRNVEGEEGRWVN